MFGCQPVVRSHDQGVQGRGEALAAVVEVWPVARTEAESAAVEVEEDGEAAEIPFTGDGGRGGNGFVKAEAEVVGFVEETVLVEDGLVVDCREGEVDGLET